MFPDLRCMSDVVVSLPRSESCFGAHVVFYWFSASVLLPLS